MFWCLGLLRAVTHSTRLEDVEQYLRMFPFSSVNICIICLEVEFYFIKIGLLTGYIKECKDRILLSLMNLEKC